MTDIPEPALRSDRPASAVSLAFVALAGFAAIYFYHYLPQGFSPYDDAYLMALGKRLSEGESLYRDIAYFRTPLSALLQMWGHELFGGAYTVLLSRILWAFQLTLIVGVCGYLCRRWFHPLELALALCATLVYSSLLFAFPWYTYDGMFFSALYALAFTKKRYFLAGVAAALAGLCKQSFLVLLPVTLLALLAVGWVSKVSRLPARSELLRLGAGFFGVCVLSAGYLFWLDLGFEFWQSVFVAPAKAGRTSLSFALFQNTSTALADTWFMLVPLAAAVTALRKHWLGLVIVAAVFGIWFDELSTSRSLAPFLVTLLSYTVLVTGLIRIARRRRYALVESGSAAADEIENEIRPVTEAETVTLVALALSLLYASGLNYSGLIFAYIGGVLALPLALALIGGSRTDYALGVRSALALGVLLVSLIAHHRFPYAETERASLSESFTSPRLSGLLSSPERVSELDGLYERVRELTDSTDRVFAFPDPSCLNLLCERRGYGPVQWFYYLEYDEALAEAIAERLRSDPPALSVLHDTTELRVPAQGQPILRAFEERFETVDSSGAYYILIPRVDSLLLDSSDQSEE